LRAVQDIFYATASPLSDRKNNTADRKSAILSGEYANYFAPV